MIYRINTSTIPLRREASDSSEMVSELLYGECCTLLESSGSWMRVQSEIDGYEGWIAREYEASETEDLDTNMVHRASQLDLGELGSIRLSPGSHLTKVEMQNLRPIAESKTSQGQDITSPIGHAYQFLNTPYRWGGRSIWGIDCSGLMQIIFALSGQKMPRDAYQQAELGKATDYRDIAEGDLAFFENSKGRITHVGILIDRENILHASGRVRIDSFDEQGIIRNTDGKRTHTLNCVKRIGLIRK